MNGVLNVSIPDGWWPEGFNGLNGWVIGDESNYLGTKAQDSRDASMLYDLLDEEVVPLYYRRDARGLPLEWIGMMKEARVSLTPMFSARRMVKEYCTRMYATAWANGRQPNYG